MIELWYLSRQDNMIYMGVANTDVTNVHICEETTRFDDATTEENDICEQTQVGLDIAQIHQNNSLFGYTWK